MADVNSHFEAHQNSEILINKWIKTAYELGKEIPNPKGRLMYA
jgi:hypothetical protein